MLNETLKPTETLYPSPDDKQPSAPVFGKPEVEALFKQRMDLLETVKPSISLKFYYQINEKLEKEKKDLERLLNIEEQKQGVAAQYSLPLNPYFFEQKFM